MAMWRYEQSTGKLSHDGSLVATGYSGYEQGKNNPAMQDKQGIGPIPQGTYLIQPPRDTDTHGPYVMPLQAAISNVMFARSGFLIHGDSVHAPGTASHGCIIIPRDVRRAIWESGDHDLTVTA